MAKLRVKFRTGTTAQKMPASLKRSREGRRVSSDEARGEALDPMVATKLWRNPCWLSFRTNFIAHHFNQPLYDLIQHRYRLTPPEHVVLYALGLQEGITADDIAASSARPKNTLSRAINSLVRKKLMLRRQDQSDRRRLSLYLTRSGRRIVSETVPLFVERERAMAAALTPNEQRTLNELLTKIILSRSQWPATV